MLVARGILTAKDGAAIKRGLKQVQGEIESGTSPLGGLSTSNWLIIGAVAVAAIYFLTRK